MFTPFLIACYLFTWIVIGDYYFDKTVDYLDPYLDVVKSEHEVILFMLLIIVCGPLVWFKIIKALIKISKKRR